MPYKGPFAITKCFTSGRVKLNYGPTKVRYNIRRIKPHKSDTKVEDSNSKDMYDDISIWPPVIYFRIEY